MRYPHQGSYNQEFHQGYNQRNMSAYMATPETVMDDSWYLDSGATHYLTNDLNNLSFSEPYKGNKKLIIGQVSQTLIDQRLKFWSVNITFVDFT